jgi:hypothetical protein
MPAVALTATAFLAGVAAFIYVIFVASSSTEYGIDGQVIAVTESTIWEDKGFGFELVSFLIPPLLALVSLIALLASRYTLAGLLLWITALPLCIFGLLTLLGGTGLLYLPIGMLLLLAAGLHGRTRRSPEARGTP